MVLLQEHCFNSTFLRRAEGLQEWAAAIEAAWRTCARWKKKIVIPIFMLNATVASFSQATNGQHRGFLEEKASKRGRYRRLAAQQVWSSLATFSTSLQLRNPGDVGAGGNRQKEQGEQGGGGVGRRKDFASRSTPALAKPSATTTSQVSQIFVLAMADIIHAPCLSLSQPLGIGFQIHILCPRERLCRFVSFPT